MEKLKYSERVYDKGAGKTYDMLIKCTLPALFMGALQVGLINSGLLFSFGTLPTWAGILLMGITIIYIIPGIFILPTVWFLRSGKTRKLKHSFVEVSSKAVDYYQVVEVTASEVTANRFSASQVKKVEEVKGNMVVTGNVIDHSTGKHYKQLEIPIAFENMDKIRQLARYR